MNEQRIKTAYLELVHSECEIERVLEPLTAEETIEIMGLLIEYNHELSALIGEVYFNSLDD